jgi:DNA-binding LacI/PurR family transcriptional regulator
MLETLASIGREGRTDAIILMNNPYFGPEKVRKLAGNGIPIALIGQDHNSVQNIDSVVIDNVRGAHSAVAHLLGSMPKSLLLITGPKDNHDSGERLAGARKAIEEAGGGVAVEIREGDYYHDGGRRVFEEYLREKGAFPDAVFAFNDAMALGVLDVVQEHGKQIPEEIQLIGFDNNEIAQYIGLSTVGFPMMQIGQEAARLVIKRINDKDAPPVTLTMATQLFARKTTA